MTCIAAVPHESHDGEKRVVFASDSACFDDDMNVMFVDGDKIFTCRPVPADAEIAVATAGDSSLLPLVRAHLKWPKSPPLGREDRWAQKVAERITRLGQDRNVTDEDDKIDGYFLLAFRGRLWSIYDHHAMAVDVPTAIGCGAPVAIGALHALAEMSPFDRARRAVEIACDVNPFCRPPVYLVEV